MQKSCIIIPCYNEANRIPQKEFIDYASNNHHVHFLFVNDCSTDNTEDVLRALVSKNKDQFDLLSLEKNRGKSRAIAAGVSKVLLDDSVKLIGFFDADLATPLSEIDVLSQAFQDRKMHFAFCSRIRRLGSSVDRTLKRHLIGRVFATAASTILELPVYDTQCGAKLFSREAAEVAFRDEFVSRWFFDVEIFHRLHKHFGDDFLNVSLEVPVREWKEIEGSKISFMDMINTPFELLKIKKSFKKQQNG